MLEASFPTNSISAIYWESWFSSARDIKPEFNDGSWLFRNSHMCKCSIIRRLRAIRSLC